MSAITSVIRDLSGSLKRDYNSKRVRAVNSLVYFTFRCTSRCKTCNIWKRNAEESGSSELPLSKWNVILENLRDYGIESMEIFGGDALLRKDLMYEVIRFCGKRGIKTYFPTNSLLMDDETARDLVDAGLDTIYFSLDDPGEGNDLIRGQSGSARLVRNAIEAVGRARKNGRPDMIIISTISKMNYANLPELIRFAETLKVDAVYPRVMEEYSRENIENSAVGGIKPEPYFTSSDAESHLMSAADARAFKDLVRRLKKKKSGVYVSFDAVDEATIETLTKGIHRTRRCMVCTNLVTIDPRGNALPCPMYNRYILGNLLEDRLGNIWGNKKHREFIRKQRKGEIPLCRNCSLRTYYPSFPENVARYMKKTVRKITGD